MADTEAAAPPTEKAAEFQLPSTDWTRLRFALGIGIYSGALGTATVLVNFLAQIRIPEILDRPPMLQSLLFGSSGALSGFLITAPIAYWLFGGIHVFTREIRRQSRSLRAWFLLSVAYGLTLPIVVGAFLLPVAFNLHDFSDGRITVPELSLKSVEILILAPSVGLILGLRMFFTGIVAALLFWPGAWLIDRFTVSEDATTARYGPWVVALALSLAVLAIASFAPVSLLARFG